VTTTRIYKCNFCGKETKDSQAMHGLHWTAEKDLEKRPAFQCESHLCDVCLTAIGRVARQYGAMRPVAAEAAKEK
jgi:DNA-directed RNA polymerase subunit RPC12/RpoP